ncbi:hypothetical protein EVAR_25809_1 [Eumeta japonica]|uniref:Reverse transcriptase/retrotransposon-derived protein RNase H-like domain-containing protein n=1 Tax=Eumeta variegata TaxID=151549 RepID=A0A4C1VWA3_EUMVA|nr:hypothetical protein EVAR_25809_1 [Eumeta japonica]
MLVHPVSDAELALFTDASTVAIEAVLQQHHKAIMTHGNKDWTNTLTAVLLGLWTVWKEDLGCLPQSEKHYFDVTTSNNSILRAACTKKLTSLSRYARCLVPQARLEWSAEFVSSCIYLPSTRSA